jgi:hypothetical protein
MTCTAKHILAQRGESMREKGRQIMHRLADRETLKRSIRSTIARIGVGRYSELEKWLVHGYRSELTFEERVIVKENATPMAVEPPQPVLYDLNRLLTDVERKLFPGGSKLRY